MEGEIQIMELQSLIHGAISILLTSTIVYYLFRTVRNIKGSEQTALSHFFLIDESAESFKKLFYSSGIYAIVSLLVAARIIPDGAVYDAATVVLFIGMLYFARAAFIVTSGPSKEDNE